MISIAGANAHTGCGPLPANPSVESTCLVRIVGWTDEDVQHAIVLVK